MHKRFLITALAVIMLVMPGQTATTEAKQHQLLTIQSPTKRQTCLQDTVEVVVELKNGADPSTFRAWLNSKEITDRFTLTGSTMTAVIDPDDGVRSYSETIETTRDDKGVWFIEGRKHKYRNKKARYNRLRAKVRGAKKRVGVAACTFEVNSSLYNTFEAMGYAIATDRLWQIELYRRTARGRLAEVFGKTQLQSDIFMRTIGYSDTELTDGFAALDAESKAVIAGYVAGINRRITEIAADPALQPFEFLAMGFFPENWTVEDILAWCALLQREFDPEALDTGQLDNLKLLARLTEVGGSQAMTMFHDLRWPNDPEAQTYIVDRKSSVNEDGHMDDTLRRIPGLEETCDRLKERRDKINKGLKKINAKVKMGSYAWVVSGKKTASGNPIIYSGPQMGFSVPSIVAEGSIRAAGMNISGMTVPGIPGIIIGRTPHHAWSMQVGHAHTTDYYIENPYNVSYDRLETISVAGLGNISLPVYRTDRGPVINPMPMPMSFKPEDYDPLEDDPIFSWRYSHWGYEFNVIKAFLGLARAQSMDDFGEGIEEIAVSQHFCYADRDGNIAYWMSGRDPVREGMDDPTMRYFWFLPQGAIDEVPIMEWKDGLVPRSHARNPERGFFAGWNNKTSPTYFNAFNSNNDIYGPFQRAHVIYDYLTSHNDLTFEDIRDLALNIATTDSFNGGGNPWAFVADEFMQYVAEAGLDQTYPNAMQTIEDWDDHFVEGDWAEGTTRPQGWVLMNDWIREVIRLTFEDELPKDMDDDGEWKGTYMGSNQTLLFNVILHAMGNKTLYPWFTNLADATLPQMLKDIVTTALVNVMGAYEADGYGYDAVPNDMERGEILYHHNILEMMDIDPIWRTPLSNRSTYAHVVEFGRKGPVRIESMFPLGESGNILMDSSYAPVFDEHFFSMTPVYDAFAPREFPLFTETGHDKKQ